MIYHLKNSVRFKVGGTESLLLINFLLVCFIEREKRDTTLILRAVHDFHLNVIQDIHLDKKKIESYALV